MKETTRIIAVYLLALIALYFSACNPVKKVLADIDKVKQVRTATDDLFPCVNDSIFTTKTDTLTTYDTTYVSNTITNTDTIIHVKDCPTKVITKTVRIRDTTTIVTQDNRELKRVNQELAANIKAKDIAQQGEIKALEDKEAERKSKNMWMWIAIGLMVAAGIGVVLKLKSWKK